MSEKEVKIIVTGDGSHSLYLPHLNETYHSSHGALTESKHVFIQAGLEHFLTSHQPQTVYILEIGFGTGLNALLAWQYAIENQVRIHFTSLEPFPLTAEVYEQLNYPELFEQGKQQQFLALHEVEWNESVNLDEFFTLEKRTQKLEDFETRSKYELIFFDAFAPSKQAELWEFEIIKQTVGYMAANAILVTYCAKGQLKRDLKALGFEVETLPGPPGKKEMVRVATY